MRGACVCCGARTGGLERSAVLRGARRGAVRALGAAVGQPLARGGLAPRPRRAQPPARPISVTASTRFGQTSMHPLSTPRTVLFSQSGELSS